jgi:sec-independent protein translocase protein TatB
VFNLSGSEIVVILLLALVVLGPDKLPEAMRKAGKTWAELRKLSSGFQEEVRKGFDEPTTEVRQTANAIKKAATLPKNPVKGAVKSLLDPPKTYTDTTAAETPAAGTTAADTPAADTTAAGATAAGATAAEAAIEAEAAAVIDAEVDAAAGAAGSPAAIDTVAGAADSPAAIDTVDIDVAIADGETPVVAAAPIPDDQADATP